MGSDMPVDLAVDLGRGLRLRSPVLVASGTFGYGFDAPQVDRTALGAIVTKGTHCGHARATSRTASPRRPRECSMPSDCRIPVSITWRASMPPFGPPGMCR